MVEAMPEQAKASRQTHGIEELPAQRHVPALGLAVTLAMVALAWVARMLLDDSLPPGFPYVTFFPAVVLTTLQFGVRLGSLSALLCGVIAWYHFIPPFNTFALDKATFIANFAARIRSLAAWRSMNSSPMQASTEPCRPIADG